KAREQREALLDKYNEQQNALLKNFEKKARAEKFALVQIQMGPYTKPDVLPIFDDKPVTFEGLAELVKAGKLTEKDVERLQKKYTELSKELAKIFKDNQKLQREKKAKLIELDREIIKPTIEENIGEIKSQFDHEKVTEYLDAVLEGILDHLDIFRMQPEEEGPASNLKRVKGRPDRTVLQEYRVNVLVDNSDKDRAPVIFENSPTFSKLFGTVERVMDGRGQWRTDFTRIRAGSFLMANGGYLVLNALDVLLEPGVYTTLKRVLKNRAAEITTFDPYMMFSITALKPEPIDVNVKVIMIGDPHLYQLLYLADDDFRKIFRIKAEFDSVMTNDAVNLLKYAEFIKMICDDQKLLPFDHSAVAEVAEYGVRVAGRQNKLSTRFSRISDLLREANFYAAEENAGMVKAKHVDKALQESIQRRNLAEEKIQELIKEGTILIDTEGARVGQVNGLSVLSLGDYIFGQPSRITAQVALGRNGITNIEREVELSGPSHDKGVLILSGYLQSKFAQDKPLSINASICFEQSYSGVEGDSASSTEIYALLSRLADLPIRQDLAVTGSVNQNGEIQPIGGVNEKIEGFYQVCKARGLTGTQGVLIPRQNVADLMLKNEVVNAVKEGKFAVYPVDRVEDGIELLTGLPAGQRDAGGKYPARSVYGKVDAKLRQYAEQLRMYMGYRE
ncbi:AAA family ATPase, partial [candidate division KSB1 bacterium]|nr:AAA family ATPase [candidate division KSB1 bacterium]